MRLRLSTSSLVKVIIGWLVIGVFLYLFAYSDYAKTNASSRSYKQQIQSSIFAKSSLPKDGIIRMSNVSLSFLPDNQRPTVLSGGVCANRSWVEGLPSIYMITPTYRRAEQIPELTRTAQTLLHVRNLVWIVVEDAVSPSQELLDYLALSGTTYVYLRAEMPSKFFRDKKKPRGVANRNAGIKWVREKAGDGVVYFGDDDNTYDLRIFEEIRSTKLVSMFPVGLVTKLGVSTPIVKNGKVIGFYDGWIVNRKFPVDMAGFAINVKMFLANPDATMPFVVGYEEDGLLKNLKVKLTDIEPKAQNCTKIWVWHTQSLKNSPVVDKELKANLKDTNLAVLRNIVWRGK